MKQILIILAVISSLIYTSYGWAGDTLPVADFNDMRRMKDSEVVDIVSPQTLLLRNGNIVELSGIDVPGRNGEEIISLAITARDILKDLLIGQRVEVYQTNDKKAGRVNRMGHELAHLVRFDNKAWAQGTLLALGLARVKTSPTNSEMASEMLALEEAARNEGLGIWEGDAYRVLSPNEADDAIGDFAILKGRIESVSLKKNRIYINFGKDWKTDFTVSIAPEDKRAFSKAKLDPLSWGAQTIRVRGSIREYNGPYMEVTHPQAIEFIQE